MLKCFALTPVWNTSEKPTQPTTPIHKASREHAAHPNTGGRGYIDPVLEPSYDTYDTPGTDDAAVPTV